MAMSRKSKIVGWSLLALLLYCTFGAFVYFASLLTLEKGRLVDLPWIVSAQKSLFRAGMSGSAASWLARPGCITPDPDLVYVPTIGSCRFDDIEFETTLTFTAEGRNTGPKPAGTGIAVIGDSHAMGWGANDLETFSAQLQQLVQRPVYNLGVASYGTARELIRLEKSGLLDRVDTVILQYCNNDYHENIEFDKASRTQLHDKVFGAQPPAAAPGNKLAFIAKGYWLTLEAPFKALADALRRKDFTRHYQPLLDTLVKHADALRGKRVIVFYSNPYGQRYRNFPEGPDATLPNVYFADLDLERSNYRKLDNHLTPQGHRIAAQRLLDVLRDLP